MLAAKSLEDTYIKVLLGSHLLHKQDFWDAKLYPHMRDDLSIYKVLLQTHMPPDCLHHTQAHGKELVPDAYGRELVSDCAVVGLQPCDQRRQQRQTNDVHVKCARCPRRNEQGNANVK